RRSGSMNTNLWHSISGLGCSWILKRVQDGALLARASFHVSFAGLAELEIAHRAAVRIVHVVHQRPVDPDLLRPRVDAERIAVPQHDVRALADAERAGLVGDAERGRRIDRQPAPGDLVRN